MNSPSVHAFRSAPPDSGALQVRSGTVVIWSLDLDLEPLDLQAEAKLLNREERERAERFHFESDRKRFIAAHAGLRRILSSSVGCAPGDLSFGAGIEGKPELAPRPASDSGSPRPPHFNLSHSQDRALVAVSPDHEVGVDIEFHRSVEVLDLAERFFTASEREHIDQVPPADRRTEFFRIWTRKEALHKCLGLGLTLKLDAFDLSGPESWLQIRMDSLGPGDHSRLRPGAYSLHQLELGPDLSACLSSHGMPQQIHCWHLDPGS